MDINSTHSTRYLSPDDAIENTTDLINFIGSAIAAGVRDPKVISSIIDRKIETIGENDLELSEYIWRDYYNAAGIIQACIDERLHFSPDRLLPELFSHSPNMARAAITASWTDPNSTTLITSKSHLLAEIAATDIFSKDRLLTLESITVPEIIDQTTNEIRFIRELSIPSLISDFDITPDLFQHSNRNLLTERAREAIHHISSEPDLRALLIIQHILEEEGFKFTLSENGKPTDLRPITTSHNTATRLLNEYLESIADDARKYAASDPAVEQAIVSTLDLINETDQVNTDQLYLKMKGLSEMISHKVIAGVHLGQLNRSTLNLGPRRVTGAQRIALASDENTISFGP